MYTIESNVTNVPAFLIKLWKLVEDATCDDLISWSISGLSFIIKDTSRFAKELLPLYFKHNNMASFIRQLNMYGFRKVLNYEKSAHENDEMEFHHNFFRKDQVDALELIKRKIASNKIVEPYVKTNTKDILTDLTSIREKQGNMDNMLHKMKQENELLWRELTSMRQKHKAQEQIIEKVIQFLVSVLQRNNNNSNIGVQRKITRMLQDSSSSKAKSQPMVLRKTNQDCLVVPEVASPVGPVIHEVTDLDDSQMAMVKSPDEILSPMAAVSENTCASKKRNIFSRINSPLNTTAFPVYLESTRSVADSVENAEESVLGLPLEYVSLPTNDTGANVTIPSTNENDAISISDSNVPEGNICFSDGNIITLPEGTTISNILSIPEVPLSAENNTISIPETNSESASLPVCLDIPDFECLGLEHGSDSLANSLASMKDELLDSASLQTPQLATENEEISSSISPKKSLKNTLMKLKMLNSFEKDKPSEEQNNQVALADHSALIKSPDLAKSYLSNHLVNVDDNLSWLRDHMSDSLKGNSLGLDDSKLLGVGSSWDSWTSLTPQLFSADLLLNDELANAITTEINGRSGGNDIVGNEIVQFNPNILDDDLDFNSSPMFEDLEDPILVKSEMEDSFSEFPSTSGTCNDLYVSSTHVENMVPKKRKRIANSTRKRRKT